MSLDHENKGCRRIGHIHRSQILSWNHILASSYPKIKYWHALLYQLVLYKHFHDQKFKMACSSKMVHDHFWCVIWKAKKCRYLPLLVCDKFVRKFFHIKYTIIPKNLKWNNLYPHLNPPYYLILPSRHGDVPN